MDNLQATVNVVENSINLLVCRFKGKTITRKEFDDMDGKFGKLLEKLGFSGEALFDIRLAQWRRVIVRYGIMFGFKEDKLIVTPEEIRNAEKH